ncbi:MAG: lipopolysaccharide biosynthesis protein RfbH [Candidatus Bathyarchaeota archaeon]|nr:lipopolysaccharide biosynthesis protein RfbH [Candidatus Bathyarchaeota archaeon]
MSEHSLRETIFQTVKEIFLNRASRGYHSSRGFNVQYAGAVYDSEEVNGMINAILDGWFGVGKCTCKFEADFAKFVDVKKAVMVNSGSSANLLSVSALMQHNPGNGALKRGDEVLTPALAFPTTINPLIQNSLVPVFLDSDLGTYNMSIDHLPEALSSKTKAIMLSHTLGNPNDMDIILEFAEDYDLFVIEDSCDALGSMYDGKYVGSFGDLATFSFYPAHHITTGEGGCVVTNNEDLSKVVRSLRDWGRACTMNVCYPLGCSDKSCPRSASYEKNYKQTELPDDYDLRYSYFNMGYNFEPTEIQAAMGLAQLRKLPKFITQRKKNFMWLYDEFKNYEDFFILPKWSKESEPCWFAFPLTVREEAPFRRKDIVKWLLRHRIESKLLFGGNITKHPAYTNAKFRVPQTLQNTDLVMHNSFFVGVYPGLTEHHITYMCKVFKEFFKSVAVQVPLTHSSLANNPPFFEAN